jgi:hypothetical protein
MPELNTVRQPRDEIGVLDACDRKPWGRDERNARQKQGKGIEKAEMMQ